MRRAVPVVVLCSWLLFSPCLPTEADDRTDIRIGTDGGQVKLDDSLAEPNAEGDGTTESNGVTNNTGRESEANGRGGNRQETPSGGGLPVSEDDSDGTRGQSVTSAGVWQTEGGPALNGAACEIALREGAGDGCDPQAEAQPVDQPTLGDFEPILPAPEAAAAQADPTIAALSLIAEIDFAGGTPQIGPPADINPWDIYVVGYPYWFWTDGPTSLNDSQESMGVEVSLEATATSVTFDTGDGGSFTCDPASAPSWSRSVGVEQPSPSCGYTWEKRSATPDHPKATHTITATTTWEVDWTAGDAFGTETVERSQSVDVVVGELQALVTG